MVQINVGRIHPEDDIDLSVGLDHIARCGEQVDVGDPLCRVHALNESAADHVCDLIKQAIVVGEDPVDLPPVVIEQVS